jgi:hypothetical protein
MATVVQLGKATTFTVGGTDFNDQLRSLTMTKNVPALDATTLASTYVENAAGSRTRRLLLLCSEVF